MKPRSFFYGQQIILFICAGAGLASYFLPWATFPELPPGIKPPQGRNIITVALFGAALLAILIRFLGPKRAVWQLCITMACAVACILIVTLDMQRIAKVERFYPEIGCLGSLGAAAALFLASLACILANAFRRPVNETAADMQQLFAAYILGKSGKGHLLEGIMERCRRDGITVHQHFEEGLVKNYDYSEAGAGNMVAQWHTEFMAGRAAIARPAGNAGVRVAAFIMVLLAIAFIVFLLLKMINKEF